MSRTVGNTPLSSIRKFQDFFGMPGLLIKDESWNPFGTWKDRRSAAIIAEAKEAGVHRLALITSGNAGYSLAKLAPRSMSVIPIVDRRISRSIRKKLADVGSDVEELDLGKRRLRTSDILRIAGRGRKERIWDVTNGFEGAMGSLVDELADVKPDVIILPVGSGETFVGLHDGLRRHHLKTRLIGVHPKSGKSIADKLTASWTPYQARLDRLTRTKHAIMHVTEKEIRWAYRFARRTVACEPSSAVIFAALKRLSGHPGTIVAINSGRGIV